MSTNENQELERIGALWKRKSKNGNNFFSGEITVGGETIPILVFPFKNKAEDNWPDAKIVIAPPREQQREERPATTRKSYSNDRRGSAPARRSSPARNDKDIDF